MTLSGTFVDPMNILLMIWDSSSPRYVMLLMYALPCYISELPAHSDPILVSETPPRDTPPFRSEPVLIESSYRVIYQREFTERVFAIVAFTSDDASDLAVGRNPTDKSFVVMDCSHNSGNPLSCHI